MRNQFTVVLFCLAIFLLSACNPSTVCPTCTTPEQMKKDAQAVAQAAGKALEKISAPLQQKSDELTGLAGDKIEQAKKQAQQVAKNTEKDIQMFVYPGAIGEGLFSSNTVSLKLTVYNTKDVPVLYQYVSGDDHATEMAIDWIIAKEEENINYVVYTASFEVDDKVDNLFFGAGQYKNFAGTFLANPDGSLLGGFAPDEANSGWMRIK